MQNTLLTVTEACQMLKVSRVTLWKMTKQKKINQPVKIGSRNIRYRMSDISQFINKN